MAVALLALGAGWYQAWTVPAYLNADEQAHVGYVLTLLDGHLPVIDQPIPVDDGGRLLQQRVARTRERHGDVWVANNPPVGYLPFLVPAAIARSSGAPSGPLLGLRLTNVAFFAGAVALTARAGRRLAGGDEAAGLLAAALLAALPHTSTIMGAGYIDGVALFCAVGLVDALTTVSVSRPTRRSLAILSAWCAVSVGIRPMSAALAGVAAAFALGIVVIRTIRARWGSPPGADPPSIVWSAGVLAAPTLLLDGWFYARNRARYGDLTGTASLNRKFGLPAGRTIGQVLHDGVWAEPVRTLFNRRAPKVVPGPPLWLWTATRGIVVAALVATVGIVVADQVVARRHGAPARTPALAWLGAGAVAAVSIALAAAHWVSGGMIHPRYLFPALAIGVVAVMLPLARLRLWWAGFALVVGSAVLQVHESPSVAYYRDRVGAPGSALADPPGGPLVRAVGPVVVAIALVVLAVALARGRRATAALPSVVP
ncbi:MAG TPA: hypothetical protein VNS19_00610 [Acidimicrobiales bacterium]|nr:hypothetical protein [Acidimicrobiales bacterium]